MMNKK